MHEESMTRSEIFEQLQKVKIIGETSLLCKKIDAQSTNDSSGPGSL
jgi:hypothetical protein